MNAFLQSGMRQCDVSLQLNLSRFSVRRVLLSGRLVATSEDRDLAEDIVHHSETTIGLLFQHHCEIGSQAVELQQRLQATRRTTESVSTVRLRLQEKKIVAHRTATGPKLTAQHHRAHLQFARDHVDWTVVQWRAVLFSDETRVCLFCNDRRRRVYRRQGERIAQACIEETVEYGGSSCMFWGGMSIDGKTDLVCVSRTGGARRQGSILLTGTSQRSCKSMWSLMLNLSALGSH